MSNLFHYHTQIEIERHRRIKMAIAAYAYEFLDSPIISDGEFDAECRKINPSISTGKPDLDLFFRTEFHPDTGSWIHRHPELEKVALTYERWYK